MVGRACRRVRGFLHDHPVTGYYVLLFVYITLVGGLALNGVNNEGERRTEAIRESGRQAFRQIEHSRIQQSLEGCRRTNRKILRPLRRQVRQDIRDLERIPPAELARFGFTRKEIDERNERKLREVRPIDCQAAARRVARSSPDFSP